MRTLNWGLLAVILIALPVTALAGVSGSRHDLSPTGAGSITNQELCFACHTPHNAGGANLWGRDLTGVPVAFTTVHQLCWTCHNGSVTNAGELTVMDAAKEQHTTPGGSDCSGGAGSCHDVHNENGTPGKFTVAGVTLTNGTYCETCHDGSAPTGFTAADGLGDHRTASGINHWTNGTTFTCNQCHTIHGATAQGDNPPTVTNGPILLANNKSAGSFYGEFCISCHNGTAPTAAAAGTGGVASSDAYDYTQGTNDGTETSHPTTSMTSSANWAGVVGGCDMCHDVHNPGGTAVTTAGDVVPNGYLLKADNTNSQYCVSCHDNTSGPGVGATTHPTGQPNNTSMNTLTAGPALPWSDQINEDGNTGADWGTAATANEMVCETCHSVHRQGATGADAEYFLRNVNGAANELCTRCHTTN